MKQKEYENVKKYLAKMEWDSVNDYADAKSDCIAKILEYAVKIFDFDAMKIVDFQMRKIVRFN